MRTIASTRHTMVNGVVVELWENPDAAFASDLDSIARYAEQGEWELLFNGILLNVDHTPRPIDGVFKAPLASFPAVSA